MFLTLRNAQRQRPHRARRCACPATTPTWTASSTPSSSFGTLAAQRDARRRTTSFVLPGGRRGPHQPRRGSARPPSSVAVVGRRLRHRDPAAGGDGRSRPQRQRRLSPHELHRGLRGRRASAPSPRSPWTPARSRSPLSDGHPLPVQRPRLRELQLLREHATASWGPPPPRTATTGTSTASASPDGGRAYLGNNSLHWGVHPGAASADTTRLKQLDAIRTTNPVNLGWNGVTSELTFKHQVGLSTATTSAPCWLRRWTAASCRSSSRTPPGTAIGNWRKIYPYENLYDSQTVDNYTQLPVRPHRRREHRGRLLRSHRSQPPARPVLDLQSGVRLLAVWGIFFNATFDPNGIGHASDGPGLQGSRGPGTWVQTKFSLDRWRGRRIRFRFLITSHRDRGRRHHGAGAALEPHRSRRRLVHRRHPGENTLTSAATVTVDTADRTALPGCGRVCSSVTASLSARHRPREQPGQLDRLDASASSWTAAWTVSSSSASGRTATGTACWATPGTSAPQLDGRPDPLQAPDITTRYGVEVRCSSLPSCQGGTTTWSRSPARARGTPLRRSRKPSGSAARRRWRGRAPRWWT